MSGPLDGARVVVVGAGTRRTDDPEAPIGIGRAVSLGAAGAGASVVCADKDAEAAAETVRMIAARGGSGTSCVADVTSEESIDALARALGEEPVTGLVLNVGIAVGKGMRHTTTAQWDLTMSTNLRSNFLVLQRIVPLLGDGASVVLISSMAGLRPGSWQPAYDASKAGVIGLTRHVALEWARKGVRANVVAPGLIDTSMGRALSAEKPKRDTMVVPLGRQGSAWEIASACAFLLSGEATYITGQVLAVDGGLSLV